MMKYSKNKRKRLKVFVVVAAMRRAVWGVGCGVWGVGVEVRRKSEEVKKQFCFSHTATGHSDCILKRHFQFRKR
jgi:hypothetical protein